MKKFFPVEPLAKRFDGVVRASRLRERAFRATCFSRTMRAPSEWKHTLHRCGFGQSFTRGSIAVLFLLAAPFAVRATDFSNVPGTVIHHDKLGSYIWGVSTPADYISDPDIVVLANGDYVASHAKAGWNSGSGSSGETSVFVSTDKGASWSALGSTLNGVLRGSLVEHGGALYIIGSQNDDDGKMTVWKSTNNGSTWTSALFSGHGGTATPNNPLVFNSRIWCASSTASLSAPVAADLLLESSWMKKYGFPANDPSWPSEGEFIGEGQIVASPGLGIHILPKVRDHALTAVSSVNSSTGVVSFDPAHDFVEFPGAEKKFGAAYDAVSGKYYALSNLVLPVDASSDDPNMIRNTAAMLSSADLYNWNVEKIFLYSSDRDQGFGYPNFDFDGNDMVIATRTAFKVDDGNNPKRAHDSNLLMFNTIADFRNAVSDHVLKLEGGDVLRYEKTQYQDAPLGTFALGSSFAGSDLTNPNGFGKDASGEVYIRETGGRILRFDAAGNFIETVASSPVSFQTSELSVDQLANASTWTKSGSGDWSKLDNWYYWRRADTKKEIAVFGSAATAATTVTIPTGFSEWTVKGLRFRSPNSYTLASDGLLKIEAASGTTGTIEVQEGSHAVQMPVVFESDVDFHSESGAALLFAEEVDVSGNTLSVSGGDGIDTPFLNLNSGKVSVMAGASITVHGYSPAFDGTLEVTVPNGFALDHGDSFRVIDGNTNSNHFDQVILPPLEEGLGWDDSLLYSSGTVSVVLRAPADWMAQFGLPSDGSADFVDSDGDSFDNYSEWKAGTNPTNAASYFDFIAAGTGVVPTGLQLQWNSITGRTYWVESSTNLMDDPSFTVLQSGIQGLQGTMEFIDTNATEKVQAFYRVHVE